MAQWSMHRPWRRRKVTQHSTWHQKSGPQTASMPAIHLSLPFPPLSRPFLLFALPGYLPQGWPSSPNLGDTLSWGKPSGGFCFLSTFFLAKHSTNSGLEENDYSCSKTEKKKKRLHQNLKLLYIKGFNQQNEKATYRMGKNCKYSLL